MNTAAIETTINKTAVILFPNSVCLVINVLLPALSWSEITQKKYVLVILRIASKAKVRPRTNMANSQKSVTQFF
jgi:hypothetical protein